MESVITGQSGATPLADGLWQGWQLIRNERRKDPSLRPLLVLLSDGEPNIPLVAGGEVLPELLGLAGQLRRDRIPALVVDSRVDPFGSGTLRGLAEALGGAYRRVGELQAGKLLEAVRRSQES
jgi:magnesium chelatase subunit D